MKVEFEKISGAKNIFLFSKKTEMSAADQIELVKKICDPYEGFYADGVVFIEHLSGADYKWYFYNSDGSSAEMCGNAVRCAHRFIQSKFSGGEMVSIQTLSGKVTSVYKDQKFHVQMTTPKEQNELKLNSSFFKSESDFEVFKTVALVDSYFVDTGVPHLVIPVTDWAAAQTLKTVWLYLRNHSHFAKGTNVTLVQNQNDGVTKAISFERGVDDFTQACGTGATAAAMYIKHRENKKMVTVAMPGGLLKVDLTQDNPILIGDAVDIGQVIINYKE